MTQEERKLEAEIDKIKAETRKIRAETDKLIAEVDKIEAETDKLIEETEKLKRDAKWYLVLLLTGVSTLILKGNEIIQAIWKP